MYTLHQQVGTNENLLVWVREYGAVVTYAILRTFILNLYVFGEAVNQPKLTEFCYFHSLFTIHFSLFTSFYHFSHNLRHQGLCFVGSLLNLLMANLYGVIEAPKVGYNRDTKGLDAAMVGHNDFGNG